MAEKAEVRAEIDAGLKERAERILKQLGISPSAAVEMLYSAGLLDCRKPTATGGMSVEEPDAGLSKGWDSLQDGKPLTADEVEQMMKEEFGL